MSSEKGLMMTCDRCGETLFRRYNGIDMSDGGYSKREIYEDATDWGRVPGIGDVCPGCKNDYESLLERYKKAPQRMRRGEG